MNNFIKKELTGRVYKPYGYTSCSVRFVIVGVRKSPYWNYYEILIGRLTENMDRTHRSVQVYSWVAYMGSKHICFDGRGTHKAIRRCIKSGQYEKLHYHTGRKVTLHDARIYDSHGNLYEDYIKETIDRDDKRV